jgi:hypothetical protein
MLTRKKTTKVRCLRRDCRTVWDAGGYGTAATCPRCGGGSYEFIREKVVGRQITLESR